MDMGKYVGLHIQNVRDMISADSLEHVRIWSGSSQNLQPLYRDMPVSAEAYTVELKRRNGIRAFCLRVLPGRRENLPLLVISPGYAGALQDLPGELQTHFTTIFLSPMGYGTPDGGQANELREYGSWPVLAHTVHGQAENYTDWLLDAACGIDWACGNTSADGGKLIFAGCSQGGAMSIVLGAIYRDRCMAICADEPFLVDCSGERIHEFIAAVVQDPYQIVSVSQAERNLAAVDPMRYAPLLQGIPVLICSGGADTQCPEGYNERLFHTLPEGKLNRYVVHPGRGHGYSSRFHETMMQFLQGELA